MEFEGRSWNYRKWLIQYFNGSNFDEEEYFNATIEAEYLKLKGQVSEVEWRSMVRLANQSLVRDVMLN